MWREGLRKENRKTQLFRREKEPLNYPEKQKSVYQKAEESAEAGRACTWMQTEGRGLPGIRAAIGRLWAWCQGLQKGTGKIRRMVDAGDKGHPLSFLISDIPLFSSNHISPSTPRALHGWETQSFSIQFTQHHPQEKCPGWLCQPLLWKHSLQSHLLHFCFGKLFTFFLYSLLVFPEKFFNQSLSD